MGNFPVDGKLISRTGNAFTGNFPVDGKCLDGKFSPYGYQSAVFVPQARLKHQNSPCFDENKPFVALKQHSDIYGEIFPMFVCSPTANNAILAAQQ